MNFRYAACIVAIKDDFCLEESINSLFSQGVSRCLIVSPKCYWLDQSPQKCDDFAELEAIAKRTGAGCVQESFRSDKTENQAVYTEALYRNSALATLFADPSIDFALTVDADEFWMPDTLAHIEQVVSEHFKHREFGQISVELPGVPVIGVPGLPVAGAKDKILVATSRGVQFSWGRATEKVARIAGTKPIIHFSATRKTLDELIAKIKKSAHYGDPSYDFDGWIEKTLPNVHVGMKNVHMYASPDNIWPEVRAWTKQELDAIPKNLHSYLKTIC